MTELVQTGFYPFVLTLSENVVKKIIWDQYFHVKGESGRIPGLKKNGASEFAAVCLLKEFGCVVRDKNIVRQCNYIFYQIFQYTPAEVIENAMKMAIERLDGSITYQDYIRVMEYIRKQYGKWLGELEFAGGREDESTRELYEQFRRQTADQLNGWETVQRNAEEIGIFVEVEKPDMALNPQTEKFFHSQEQEAREKYSGYEDFDRDRLYGAYKSLAVIPCKTVYAAELAAGMEEKLSRIEEAVWRKTLSRFQEAVKDKRLENGRVVYGDNEYKTKQAENAFVSSGKFEHIMLFHDTSKLLNGREGMAITTEKLYYKSFLNSGEIDINEISHFEFSGTAFSQKLTVVLVSGKKCYVPCNVGKTEHYKYLKVLEELLRVLKMEMD